ncbi:MAG: hypothetical protein QF371_00655 [Flavobacteriales bacterium]|nr:hypothetical protein [Flavobacteriales bacterium]
MRVFGIFGLGFVLMMQVLSASFIVLNHTINQSYIIENFCENKEKPELKCNGKCHLKKQIKEDSEKKSEVPANLSELLTFVLIYEEIDEIALSFLDARSRHASPYSVGSYSQELHSVFHPPQV